MSLNNFPCMEEYHNYRANLNEKRLFKNEVDDVIELYKPKNKVKNLKYNELKVFFKEAYLTDVEDNIPKGNR